MKPVSSLEEKLSEETASKLAIGYRKLIKISSDSDKEELTAMVNIFETRYSKTPICRKLDLLIFGASTKIFYGPKIVCTRSIVVQHINI